MKGLQMAIRKRLETHKSLLYKILFLEQRLDNLAESLVLPATTNLAQTLVQGGETPDHLPLKLHQIEVIRAELEGLYILRDQEYDNLWQAVDSLSNTDEMQVLYSCYFWLLDNEAIAKEIFGDREDFQERRKSYRNRVSKLHSSAMSKLANMN